MQNISNTVGVKTLLEEGRLDQKRMYLENIRSANIERLNYSLEIATAAGIKKPVYSSGLAVKDDPDYSVVLGVDGIEKKLAIEKSITDVAKLDVDFNNEQYHLDQLRQVVIPDIHFSPFKYQLSPSLPLTKDGPGKGIVVLLAAALGGLLTCGVIVLRRAMNVY
jgi:Chain length determinant protein